MTKYSDATWCIIHFWSRIPVIRHAIVYMQITYLLAVWLFVVLLSNLVAICIFCFFSVIYRCIQKSTYATCVGKRGKGERIDTKVQNAELQYWNVWRISIAAHIEPWSISCMRLIASRCNAVAHNEWYSRGADIRSYGCVYKQCNRVFCDDENWLVFQRQKVEHFDHKTDLGIIQINLLLDLYRQQKTMLFYVI